MTKGFDKYLYTVSVYGNIKVNKSRIPTRKQIKADVKENIDEYLKYARIEDIENSKTQTSYIVKEESKK